MDKALTSARRLARSVALLLALSQAVTSCGGKGKPEAAAPARTTGDVVTGKDCESDRDCGKGYRCHDSPTGSAWVPDGYCIAAIVCMGGKGCPPGTLCSPLPWAQIPGVCLRECAGDADCRAGFSCRVVELFPGEADSPRSPGTVCWSPEASPPP